MSDERFCSRMTPDGVCLEPMQQDPPGVWDCPVHGSRGEPWTYRDAVAALFRRLAELEIRAPAGVAAPWKDAGVYRRLAELERRSARDGAP